MKGFSPEERRLKQHSAPPDGAETRPRAPQKQCPWDTLKRNMVPSYHNNQGSNIVLTNWAAIRSGRRENKKDPVATATRCTEHEWFQGGRFQLPACWRVDGRSRSSGLTPPCRPAGTARRRTLCQLATAA